MNHIECYACNGGATKCLFTNPSTCPPDIYSQFTGWGQLLVSTLNASIELNPQGRTLNGGFITSCLQHGQQENGVSEQGIMHVCGSPVHTFRRCCSGVL